MTTVFKNVNLLNPESFKFEKKLFVKDELFNSEFKESKKIAEIITLCNLYNVKLDKRHFLYGLKDAELDQVRSAIVKYVGVSIFDLDKVYGLQEAIKTILQYARDYGSFDIPREFWDSEVKIPKFKYKETIISCLTFTDYIKELQSIIASSKNPDSRDLNYLQQTVNLETLCCGVIPNRNVLKELVKNVKNFKFKCHTTASLRVFIEAKLDSKQKLKTSDKTFIMNTLNQLDKAEILDDFAANRRFWKFTERNVIPTQKRYEKFKKARAAFANLRDNAFYESNNSKIENAEMDLIEKFNQMRELKSDNFAIRNVTKLLSWYNPDDNEVEELIEEIKKTNVSLKQLLELFRSIDYSGVDRNYVKIKGKFWSYERERKDNRLMFELLQDVVKEKFKALTNDYMKDINSETKLAEDYKKLPSIEVPNSQLKGIAIPTSTDKFFEIDFSKHYITRGSRLELSRFIDTSKPYGVFVAWKSKDNREKHMDIDLSCNFIKAKDPEFDSEFSVEKVNFTRLYGTGIKHSGDWTSCKAFNPLCPVIVAEMIKVEPKKPTGRLDFMINCYNGVSIKDYEVYVGLIDYEKVRKEENEGRALIDPEEAAFCCKLGGDQNGFIKLFSIENNTILIEGSEISSETFNSSNAAIRESIISTNYFDRFSSFDVLDLLKMIGAEETGTHNPYKLNLFLNTVVNL